ncbi:MAG: hypothetical protein K0V04_20385 [Deltaproteobacteria bacterium]|nr:hypothetical protein [Deltaproteobacteria bacterium]
MVHIAADLPQFIQHRELAAYEQHLARTAYAYGVDLRRAAWLASSTLGDPLMRVVDRRWSRLVQSLEEDTLRPLRKAPPTELLEELARIIQVLRAPLPTLRLLRPEVAASWPAATALGTTKGGIHWLVLDLDRIMAMPADERTFVLGSALGHLQCDHGAIFAAHLLAERSGRRRWIAPLLGPWAKVAVFSADRAGLVASQSLTASLRAAEFHQREVVSWMPKPPDFDERRAALQDFDRSRLMTRRRLLSDENGGGWSMAPPGREEELDTLTRKLAAAFGGALRMGGRLAARMDGRGRRAAKEDDAEQTQGAEPQGSDDAEAAPPPPPGRDRAARADDVYRTASEAEPSEAAPSSDRASRLERALRDAWTLARCDQRLTRRLGLL